MKSDQLSLDFTAPPAQATVAQSGGGRARPKFQPATPALGSSADIRTQMNGKTVYEVPARSIINFESGFSHKLLCTGPTFTTGSACAYTCSFCYVPDLMRKNPHLLGLDEKHEDIVIRRAGAIEAMRQQLAARRRSKCNDLDDPEQVIYASPLVDVAANMVLVRETIDACTLLLGETAWQIRLLSKSNLLPLVAAGIPEKYKARVIYGVSTGTLDDNLARAFEQGTPLVSKRLHSLHVLQDRGYRTFGMICPSLPLPGGDYTGFARAMHAAIRGDRCEHVWGEILNVRGESMVRTINALQEGGFAAEAAALARVSTDKAAWEEYARATFEAHAPLYAPGKLRFLQYVTKDSKPWWGEQQARGAILL